MPGYLSQLHRFVDREYDVQTAQVRDTWRRPVSDRVAEGEAIAGIRVVRVQHPYAWLRCRVNLSKFRPGDTLRLSRGTPTEHPHYACRLEEDQGTELVVHAGYRVSLTSLSPGQGWVLDREPVDVRFLLHAALDELADGSRSSQRVLQILRGQTKPAVSAGAARGPKRVARRIGLDRSQAEAYARALATRNFYLVQGPPGTGKTHLLAWLGVALAQSGERVLITALTHRAINNALRKIAKTTGFKRVAKIGQSWRADDLAWNEGSVPNFEYFDSSPYRAEGTGYILGGTCFAVRTRRLRDIRFDTVIFDESGQLTLPLAAAGMLAGQRYIFIGDHKQMAPVVVADHEQDWVARSAFEHLFVGTPGTMLTTTYRMNAEINDYPNQRFYDGRLKPSAEARERVLRLGGQPGAFSPVLGPSPSAVFVAANHSARRMRAPQEGEIAAGIVAEALGRGLPPTEIAVVAPYRAQVRLIRAALHERGIQPGGNGVVVDTVERIQGQEREVTVISLTASDPRYVAEEADFYFQPNRLNVAITRSRVKRIVIGSPRLFQARPAKTEHRRWVRHFEGLYKASHVFKVSPGDSGVHSVRAGGRPRGAGRERRGNGGAEYRSGPRCPNCGAPVARHYGSVGREWVGVLICEDCGWSL